MACGALAAKDVGPWSYSSRDETTIYSNNSNGITWKVFSWSAYDEDKGFEYIRLEHQLDALIKATDAVTFELSFTSQSDPWTNKQVIAEDAAVCKVVRST